MSTPRAHNFSAGPAALPEPVLLKAQAELLDYQGAGVSIMEMSHRSKTFIEVAERAEANLRTLLTIPAHYRVLFLQGGASQQFAMVPLNLAAQDEPVDYVDTGAWSKKAIKEAQQFSDVRIVASSAAENYSHIPPVNSWHRRSEARYLHICSNETIGGVQFAEFPAAAQLEDVPLVADMSSDFLSRPLEIENFGLIYAGAQKNVAPAGLTLVIVREDLLAPRRTPVPSMLNYGVHAQAGSMSNTPPTFAWYMAGLVFEWLLEEGGLAAIQAKNEAKSAVLYNAVDASNFYQCPVQPGDRSHMNVPFTLADTELDAAFLAGAQERGLHNLKGHRSVGGMRASIYNAVPLASVEALVDYMNEFEREQT